MIAVLLAQVAELTSTATLGASSDGGPAWLLVLGPLGAGGVYFGLWRYYRNTHTSHSFERETRVTAQPITGSEAKVDEVKGTKRRSIDGDNRTSHRERVQRF
jgi:hypothetical protein